MWLMHDFPCLKPACSWSSSLSNAVVMHWRIHYSPCVRGDPFGFACFYVSDCLFGRFHHCSVLIINCQGRFILEDAKAVFECDAEFLLDECVL